MLPASADDDSFSPGKILSSADLFVAGVLHYRADIHILVIRNFDYKITIGF